MTALLFTPKYVIYFSEYIYSPSGIYYCPRYTTLQEYRDFIETFPIIEDPEIFGMHENANIIYQVKYIILLETYFYFLLFFLFFHFFFIPTLHFFFCFCL